MLIMKTNSGFGPYKIIKLNLKQNQTNWSNEKIDGSAFKHFKITIPNNR